MRLAVAMLKPINPAATVLFGIFTFMWGVWLCMPWDVFKSASLFEAMDDVANETVWGIGAMAVGIIIIYGAARPSYGSLVRSSGAGSLLWLFVALSTILGDYQNTGGVTYFFIATYSAFIYLNVKVNHNRGVDWADRE